MIKTDKALKVNAINSKNKNMLELEYAILDIDISDRWISLINKNNDLKRTLRYNYRRILTDLEVEEKFQDFKNNILYINDHYDRKLTDIISLDFLHGNQDILNDLHEEYEIYGDRLAELVNDRYFDDPMKSVFFNPIWSGIRQNKILHEGFLLLNEQIHNFEAIFRSYGNNKRFLCTCLFDFMPSGIHENLKPEDFMLFSPESQWGWAYLGYNTLGKHWGSACHDNDIEAVKRKAIRPQQRFAAETYLNFNLNSGGYSTRVKLYKWWLKNNFSEIHDPNMRLNEFCLGFIPIAKFTGYKINNLNWTTIDEKTNQEEWNASVWSLFDTIDSVEIITR